RVVEAGSEAFREVADFVVDARGNGYLTGDRAARSLERNIDMPVAAKHRLLDLRLKPALFGQALYERLQVLVLQPAPSGQRGQGGLVGAVRPLLRLTPSSFPGRIGNLSQRGVRSVPLLRPFDVGRRSPVASAGSGHDPFAPGTCESLVHLGQRHRPQVEIPVRSLDPADRLAHTEALEVVGPEGRETFLEFL